jgi:hypothetical protein
VTTGVVDVIEDFMDVVGDEAIAAPLAEETGSDEDEETTAVAFGTDEFHPAVALELLFRSDSVSDLGQLKLDQFVVLVAVHVHAGKDLQSPLVAALQRGDSGTNQAKVS